jgi:D-glycero-alpha-D-manno-heptose 1-phosphate guanylyltransferase
MAQRTEPAVTLPATSCVTSAIVLAGGLGTRLRSAVPDLPKPMAPVAGRPFLAHLLDQWMAQGIRHVVLSVGYRHEVISQYFGHRYEGLSLDYAVETTPLGTGGGVLLAAERLSLDAPFLLLNGDTYFDVRLADLQAHAQRCAAGWCLSLFRAPEPGRYMGVELDGDSRITQLQADPERIGRLANGGVYLVQPRSLQGLDALHMQAGRPVSLETELFPRLMARGERFIGFESPGAFIDIGLPHDFHRAADVLPAHIPSLHLDLAS